MNTLKTVSRWLILGTLGALAFLSLSQRGSAQDTSNTTVQHGSPTMESSVRNAEVVYVEGNDLVLKLEGGKLEHLVVPDSDVFTIDGRDVSVHDLKAGTKLSQTISTTTTPRYVNTVRTIKGKVWHVNAPTSVIVTLPDHTNQVFRVPGDAKFIVDGKEKTAHDLRKGMSFEATIVTDDPHTVVSQKKTVVGQTPPPLPRLVGVLLFPPVRELQLDPPPTASVTAEHTSAAIRLPQTASPLPWIALFGFTALALYLGFRSIRNRKTY